MSIKYFVRTTLDRQLDSSYSQIEYELLIDKNHNVNKIFGDQLLSISNYDVVLLEDDLILCKDFKNRIEKVIHKYPNKIINFFTMPMKYFYKEITGIAGHNFCYNQCTYIPKELLKMLGTKINEIIKNGYTKKYLGRESPEAYIKYALCELQIGTLTYRPCLVQHIDDGSLMNHTSSFSRRTPFFIDYLDELGITYEEAGSEENKKKLKALLKEKFKEANDK